MTIHASPNPPAAGRPSPALLAPQFFPDDAQAFIYQPERSVMTSGKAQTREWKLRFERRTAPFIEPLMGWTGGDDTLTQVELSFSSIEAAIAYARRQGLRYIVQGATAHRPELRVIGGASTEPARAAAHRRRIERVENALGPHAVRHGAVSALRAAANVREPSRLSEAA